MDLNRGSSQQRRTPTDRGAPPTKRAKSNPIITKYPPPPGYGYADSNFKPGGQQSMSQLRNPAYGYSAPQWNGVSLQASHHGSMQTSYQWNGHLTPYASPAFSPPGFYHSPTYSGPPPVQTSLPAAQSYPTPITPWHPSPPSGTIQPWMTPYSAQSKRHSFSFSPPADRSISARVLDGNGDAFPPLEKPSDDLEDDFFDECYFARRPDEIVPELSLGYIEWEPASRTRRALSSIYHDSEPARLSAGVSLRNDEEVVSDYFVGTKREETLLSVRQTELWYDVCNDSIFREFDQLPTKTLSWLEVRSKYRDRRDGLWIPTYAAESSSSSPTPEPGSRIAAHFQKSGAINITMDIDQTLQASSRDSGSGQGDTLTDLDQSSYLRVGEHAGVNRKRTHSRASSTASLHSQRSTKRKVHTHMRDQKQEDILAALGVTGSPKRVYETPGPALGPAPTSRESSVAPSSRGNFMPTYTKAIAPPPPIPPQSAWSNYAPESDLWNSSFKINSFATDRRDSSHNSCTAVGSDSQDGNLESTPKPPHSQRRKRDLEETDGSIETQSFGDENEDTPKPRRKLPKVQDAYW